MAESTRYHRIVLTMNSPWNLAGETSHDWHSKFSLSGAAGLTQAQADATALDLWDPIRQLTGTLTSLIRYAYYPAGSSVSSLGKTYSAGTHHGDNSGYSPTSQPHQQLEVCVLARCPVGKNSKGRQVYLRKWIHDVLSQSGDPNTIGSNFSAATICAKWNSGSGPNALVPVDPTDGTQGGPWQLESHLFTHQLRRGSKRKVTLPGTNSVDIPPIEP